jgi:hypothetical protein
MLKNGMRVLIHQPEQPKFYLLALFHEEEQVNKVCLFHTIKEAREYYHNQHPGWIAYVIDLKYQDERPFIKLN